MVAGPALAEGRALVEAKQRLVRTDAERAELLGARPLGDEDRDVVQPMGEGRRQASQRLADDPGEAAGRKTPAITRASVGESHGWKMVRIIDRTTSTPMTANTHCIRDTPLSPHEPRLLGGLIVARTPGGGRQVLSPSAIMPVRVSHAEEIGRASCR